MSDREETSSTGMAEALAEILACADFFYTEGESEVKRLPPELRPWAGPLRVIFDSARHALSPPEALR